MDHPDPNDYKLGFEDRQNLQRLRLKPIKAAALLDASDHLVRNLGFALEKMSVELGDEVRKTISHELEDLHSEAEYYMRCIEDLQQRTSDTATMV